MKGMLTYVLRQIQISRGIEKLLVETRKHGIFFYLTIRSTKLHIT